MKLNGYSNSLLNGLTSFVVLMTSRAGVKYNTRTRRLFYNVPLNFKHDTAAKSELNLTILLSKYEEICSLYIKNLNFLVHKENRTHCGINQFVIKRTYYSHGQAVISTPYVY